MNCAHVHLLASHIPIFGHSAAAALIVGALVHGGRINHPELQDAADREHGPAHPH